MRTTKNDMCTNEAGENQMHQVIIVFRRFRTRHTNSLSHTNLLGIMSKRRHITDAAPRCCLLLSVAVCSALAFLCDRFCLMRDARRAQRHVSRALGLRARVWLASVYMSRRARARWTLDPTIHAKTTSKAKQSNFADVGSASSDRPGCRHKESSYHTRNAMLLIHTLCSLLDRRQRMSARAVGQSEPLVWSARFKVFSVVQASHLLCVGRTFRLHPSRFERQVSSATLPERSRKSDCFFVCIAQSRQPSLGIGLELEQSKQASKARVRCTSTRLLCWSISTMLCSARS